MDERALCGESAGWQPYQFKGFRFFDRFDDVVLVMRVQSPRHVLRIEDPWADFQLRDNLLHLAKQMRPEVVSMELMLPSGHRPWLNWVSSEDES